MTASATVVHIVGTSIEENNEFNQAGYHSTDIVSKKNIFVLKPYVMSDGRTKSEFTRQ